MTRGLEGVWISHGELKEPQQDQASLSDYLCSSLSGDLDNVDLWSSLSASPRQTKMIEKCKRPTCKHSFEMYLDEHGYDLEESARTDQREPDKHCNTPGNTHSSSFRQWSSICQTLTSPLPPEDYGGSDRSVNHWSWPSPSLWMNITVALPLLFFHTQIHIY